jgi:RNA polymerase sigma-70 factor (ECF subfamily)
VISPALDLADPDALEDTLRALLPHVRRWLVRLLGRTPDLDDATQEALTEIARFLPRFEGRCKLETVAHKITLRVAYRYFGAPKEVGLESVPEPIDPAAGPHARAVAREALARLQRCLRKLPAKRRAAFVLVVIEGLTPTEAAGVAGTTALAMRCRVLWARREITRMMKDDPWFVEVER